MRLQRLRSFYLIVPLLCLFLITNVRGDVGSSIRGGGGSGGPSLTGNNTFSGTNVWTVNAIQPQAGIDFNVNSSTLGFLKNTSGGANIVLSNNGSVTISGNGANGDIITKDAITTSSTRQYVKAAGKVLSNTSVTTTTFVRIAETTAHSTSSGTVDFGIKISDGTNDIALSGIIRWSYVNTAAGAGGEVCNAAVIGTVDQTAANGGAASSGTASATASGVTGTDLCDIQITPTFSLTPTTVEIYYTVFNQSKNSSVTPQ